MKQMNARLSDVYSSGRDGVTSLSAVPSSVKFKPHITHKMEETRKTEVLLVLWMLLSKSKFYIVGLTSEENRSMQGSVKRREAGSWRVLQSSRGTGFKELHKIKNPQPTK